MVLVMVDKPPLTGLDKVKAVAKVENRRMLEAFGGTSPNFGRYTHKRKGGRPSHKRRQPSTLADVRFVKE